MVDVTRDIYSGMQILIEDENPWLIDHAVIVEEGKIKAIIPAGMISHHLPARHYQFPSHYRLIPGFIDLHVHGAQGYDVMDASEEAFLNLSKALAQEGVTGYLATTMVASNEKLEAVLRLIPEAKLMQQGAALLGVHLEGPFITRLGAQAPGLQQQPNADLVKRWQQLSGQAIKIVTLAPELTHGIGFIHTLIDMDIIPAIGHTHASYEQTMDAIAAGCTYATHLFNAMQGLHQRQPGAVTALLLSNHVKAEIIVDGIHLHPAIVELIYRLKGLDRLMLVTDAMRAKCLRNGRYDLGGQMVDVHEGKATLADGTLAGSTLSMPDAIRNFMSFTQCTLEQAIKLATLIPARILGLQASKGSIAINKAADLVVMDDAFKVHMTVRAGQEIFKS